MAGRQMRLAVALLAMAGIAGGLAGGLAAQEGLRVDSGGSIEARPFLSWSGASLGKGEFSTGSSTTSAFDLRVRGPGASVRASAGASFEAAVLAGASAEYAWLLAEAGRLPPDLFVAPSLDGPVPELATALRIRTAWAKLDWGWAEATVGRQVLNYGRGALWSPVDIFSSLEASGISTTRRGIDALRLKVPMGDTGILDIVAAGRKEAWRGSYAIRFGSLLASGLDFGALGAWAGEDADWLAGADVKVDLGASFYGEALYAAPADGGEGLFRAAAGADWSAGDFILAVEYYWNGGVGASSDPYGAGRHNLYGSITWRATDFVSLAANASWDIGSATGKALVACLVDASQNASLVLYATGARTEAVGPVWSAETGIGLTVKF